MGEFRDNIIKDMHKHGFSNTRELARALFVTENYLLNILSGSSKLSASLTNELQKVLHWSEDRRSAIILISPIVIKENAIERSAQGMALTKMASGAFDIAMHAAQPIRKSKRSIYFER